MLLCHYHASIVSMNMSNKTDTEYDMQRAGSKILPWDDTYMLLAETVAMTRSKDPRTQVGAFIADKDHRPLGFGYNGTPKGWDDETFPWASNAVNPLEMKDLFVIHAERNAIANAPGGRNSLIGATMYVSLYPCNVCAQEIANAGITRLVYRERREGVKTDAADMILKHAGVDCIQLPPLDVASTCRMLIDWNHADIDSICNQIKNDKKE